MSIIPRRHFWTLIDPQEFCNTLTQKLILQEGKVDPRTWSGYTYPVEGKGWQHSDLPETGAFYLVLSNCGSCLNQTVSGSVEVKNTHGYLPANEYYKLSFYRVLLAGFAAAALAWAVQLSRWSGQIHTIHHCLTFVLTCAVTEALMWSLLLSTWNSTGGFEPWMLCGANLASVLKTGLCYVLVCYIAQGWGVTQESLESVAKTRVELFACFYFPIQYIFEGILAFRHSHRISTPFMMMCWGPSFLMNVIVFYWIFTDLISVLESAKRTQQPGLSTLLRRLGKTMTVFAVITLVAIVFRILDISSNDPPASWHGQWVLAEGMSDGVFFLVTIAMLFTLAPFRNMKEYLYTATVPMDDLDPNIIGSSPAVWADEDGGGMLDDDDKDDADGFWTMTHPEAKGRGADSDDSRGKPSPKSKTTGVADHDLLG